MKKSLLLFFGIVFSLGLQAQSLDHPTLQRLLERISPKAQKAVQFDSRAILSCTRETIFQTETGMSWDSSEQTIVTVDDDKGFLTRTEDLFIYELGANPTLAERVVTYGTIDPDNMEAPFDSIVTFAGDPISGDLVEFIKIFPTLSPTGKIVKLDIYFNTGIFGLPLGTILFGINNFYYDANDYLIATASKQASFDNFPIITLVNADSTFYTNNTAGQPLIETSWEWDTDLNVYAPISRNTYTYVFPGGDESSLVFESWDGADWIYNSRTLSFYNKPGQLNRNEFQIGAPGSWITVQELLFTYDNQDRLIQALNQSVDNDVKIPIFRELVNYDKPEGWITETIGQFFNLGNWENSERRLFENCDNVGLALAAPTNLTAIPAGSTSILLNWQDNATAESGYQIERSINGVDFAQIGQIAANSTSHLDNQLNAATTYYYRVRATGQGNFSGYSNIASAATWTTSIDEAAQAGFLGAYFNSMGQIELQFDEAVAPAQLQVFDVQGRQVLVADVRNGTRQVNATQLHSGVYFIRIALEDGRMATRKAVR